MQRATTLSTRAAIGEALASARLIQSDTPTFAAMCPLRHHAKKVPRVQTGVFRFPETGLAGNVCKPYDRRNHVDLYVLPHFAAPLCTHPGIYRWLLVGNGRPEPSRGRR